jgi:hypothetical protein
MKSKAVYLSRCRCKEAKGEEMRRQGEVGEEEREEEVSFRSTSHACSFKIPSTSSKV